MRTMFKTLIILAFIGITLIKAKETCREKIKKKFPNSKCIDVDNLKDCKAECEHLGQKECQGKRGKIERKICKGKHQEKSTCCCK